MAIKKTVRIDTHTVKIIGEIPKDFIKGVEEFVGQASCRASKVNERKPRN